MVRTQIQLTDQQARRLRRHARERGLSLAEVIRRCVDKGLAEDDADRAARYQRAANAVGCVSGPPATHDLAGRHDDHLDEAFD